MTGPQTRTQWRCLHYSCSCRHRGRLPRRRHQSECDRAAPVAAAGGRCYCCCAARTCYASLSSRTYSFAHAAGCCALQLQLPLLVRLLLSSGGRRGARKMGARLVGEGVAHCLRSAAAPPAAPDGAADQPLVLVAPAGIVVEGPPAHWWCRRFDPPEEATVPSSLLHLYSPGRCE